jgi:ATP-dependent RNA helicase DHX57
LAPDPCVVLLKRYHETAGGAVEADADAKELSFHVQRSQAADGPTLERVWLHPGSLNFKENKFASPFLVFNECVTTSRPFLRDCTEVSPYALLLFGGALDVDVARGTVAVATPGEASGAWCRFGANARIGVLVQALRLKLEELLLAKMEDPAMEIDAQPAAAAAARLLISEGMG